MPGESRGKLVILLILVVAVGMGAYAWWHQYQSGRRSAAFWGVETAVLVRYAPEVSFVPLQPSSGDSDSTGESVSIFGAAYSLGPPLDVSKWRGLVHARHALVNDLSFDWQAPPPAGVTWEFLLRFRDRERTATAAFAPQQDAICYVEGERQIRIIPSIAAAFRLKRDEWRKGSESP